MVDSTPAADSFSSSTSPSDLSIQELQEFADLLILIRLAYNVPAKMTTVDTALYNLYGKPYKHSHSINTLERYIGRIALYLRSQGNDLLHPWKKSEDEKQESIEKRIAAFKKETGPWSNPAMFPLKEDHGIREFMADLKRCFVALDETGQPEKRDEQGRYVLKSLTNPVRTLTHQFTLLFWHWTKYVSKENLRLGSVVTGRLLIYDNWNTAHFSYILPGGRDRDKDKEVQYTGTIKSADKNYEGSTWWIKNRYLTFDSIPGLKETLKQSTGLTMVLAVRQGHPDNTVLEGSFVAADPIFGYPASGRIFLIEDTYLQPGADATNPQSASLNQQRDTLFAFGRQYVAYQTQTAPVPNGGSFTGLDDIPGFNPWRAQRKLLEKTLYGYCLRAANDEITNQTKRHLSRFTLKIDNHDADNPKPPAQIQYLDSPDKPIDYGYITIEQADGDGQVTYKGAFHYLAHQQRFRYQIQFIRSKAPGSTWYIGTASGLNRHRSQVLAGRFVIRPEELDERWLESKKLAELLFHYDPTLGAFLLETDQQIPTETLPLYHQLRWPHLPRINRPTNELAFNKWVMGDYGCYALVRRLVHNKSHYSIAFYPIRIGEDGYFQLKSGVDNIDGQKVPIEHEGRAFSAIDDTRLYLYVDQADQRPHPFQAGFYFRIKGGEKLTSAYGVSERFVNRDDPPEARFEALIELKGSTYDEAQYQEFDPFKQEDRDELNRQEPHLAGFLAGRANRLILANRHLHPNRPIPEQIRQDPFRRLHIRAALYEIEHESFNNVEGSLELLRDSYLHGFGLVDKDIEWLNETLKPGSFFRKRLEEKWSPDNLRKLLKEIGDVWPTFNPNHAHHR